MLVNKIITSIIDDFTDHVRNGLFSIEFIGSERAYYSGGRCHSRVLGLLVQRLQRLGYCVDIERSVTFHIPKLKGTKKRKMNMFRPDITVVDASDRIVGIVEYETIDATEEHFLKKIDYFERSLPANPDIKFIIFMHTLTTLKKRPNKWIEMDRSIYINPLTGMMSKLSSSFPAVEFCFAFLKEDGITARNILNGIIKKELKKNIF